MEIVLKAKGQPVNGDLRCACGTAPMETWGGCPVVACDAEGGVPICRACAIDQSPLLVSLADLAAVAMTRPSRGTEPILEAAANFRAVALDAAQAGALAFALEHGVRKLND